MNTKNLTLGTCNLTIWNLSNATDTNVPVTDPRVSLSANLLKVATPGLIDGNQSYAIRIAPGAVKGNGGAGFAGITNDTIWNFTTAAGDPLLVALAALKDHINGVTNLTAAPIAAYSQTIALEAYRFADSATNIAAVFDLVSTYDRVKGSLWIATCQLTRSAEANDLTWTIYRTMQSTMDKVDNAPTLATYEALLRGFKFNSSSNFPGRCAPPADPNALTRTVSINGSYPRNWGHSELQGDKARKPTGTYLAPGSIATITVPPSLVGRGYKIRVGAHAWDMSSRPACCSLFGAGLETRSRQTRTPQTN